METLKNNNLENIKQISQIQEKGVGIMNEDSILIKDNIFGVFDGASSLNKYINDEGKTGGYLASSIVKEIFEKNDKPLIELAKEANDKLEKEMLKHNIDVNDKVNRWNTTASVVKINKETFEYLQICDSAILVINKNGTYKVINGFEDHDEETIIKWQKLAEEKIQNIRDVLLPTIIDNRRKANIDYGVLNGEQDALNLIHTGSDSLKDIASILILSDGLLIPKKDPTSKENWELLVDLYQKGGLENIKNYIRNIENNDPNCWDYPRLKKSDDISAVALDFK